MRQVKQLFFNTILLTAASLGLRLIGLGFQVYIAARIGASAVGVYSLITSAYTIFVTLATSGIRFAMTRLTAEELARGGGGVRRLVRSAVVYSLFFSLLSSGLLFSNASLIGLRWIGEASTVLPLRLLAFALPFLSLSAVFGGYFTAVQRVAKAVSAQLAEQLCRIALTVFLLTTIAQPTASITYALLVIATCAGEVLSFLLLLTLYLFDRRRYGVAATKGSQLRAIFAIAFPLAVSSYMRTGLLSLGHMLIPRGLKRSGLGGDAAFAAYGVIHGMVFPVLLFPSALMSALAEMLIPPLTQSQSRGHVLHIQYTVSRVFHMGLTFAVGVAGILYAYAMPLGELLYHSNETGHYMRLFAPLVVVMYMDMLTDGCLKGLGQHLHSMLYNIIDAATNVVLLFLLLPRLAIAGYVISVFVTETLNFLLSLRRLRYVTTIRLPPLLLWKNIACILLACSLITRVFPNLALALSIALSIVLYAMLLYLVRAVTREDIRWFFSIVRQPKPNQ